MKDNTKNKRHYIPIPLILLAGLAIFWLAIGGFPIVLHHTSQTVFPAVQKEDTIINPLKNIDMHNSKVFLLLTSADCKELPDGMPARRILVCTDTE
ncbi:MAG: hypothetical protein J5605_09625, partial [Bacteroidales bacterium]|nr:hypothetical protein [Bacteroidales bacterium]